MSSIDLASPDKKTIQKFFDAIAFRYDLLNSLLSFRLDDHWRRKARDLVRRGSERAILDLGVGTGKFLQQFLDTPNLKRAVGLDFSAEMLRKARQTMPASVFFICADFHELPFRSRSFDLVISSFTLRSVKEIPGFFGEVYRLLVDEGQAAFLCLTRPQNLIWRAVYYPYLQCYLPLVGRLVSGNRGAYQFLSKSIQNFQSPRKTVEMMFQAGFRSVKMHSFTGGASTLFIGKK
jgi:demethylmenaquinone methyltransferase/2-methoxy-6-polyprenyl-1,4-benzoquinol methylase